MVLLPELARVRGTMGAALSSWVTYLAAQACLRYSGQHRSLLGPPQVHHVCIKVCQLVIREPDRYRLEANVYDTTGEVSQEAVSSGAAEQAVQAEGRDSDGNGLAAEQGLQEQDAELIAVKVRFVNLIWVLILCTVMSFVLMQGKSWQSAPHACALRADCAEC